jgi:Zn-dependent protease
LDKAFLLERVMLVIPLILSLSVHEFFHAWTAWRLGDDTAARLGRLTLNPIAHIDPIGTLLLPLMGVPFGWAKPVPTDVSRIRRGISMNTGSILISAAGPVSNLGLAVVSAIAFGLLLRIDPTLVARGSAGHVLLVYMILINVGLAIFNLLPIPPLDGSHVAEALMPTRWRGAWESFARLAPFLLLFVFVFGRHLIVGPRDFVVGLLEQLISAIA